jgi:uncharacterized phage-associated protein
MISCHDVAAYFLSKVDEESGDSISNLKLQKLLYYAQGLHIAMNGEPLFPEQIEAWTHGPVVPACYHAFKQHGSEPIPTPDGFDPASIPPDIAEFLDEVYAVYGQFSAWRLRDMTHEEAPWLSASATGGEISHEILREFFATRLVDG